MGNSEKPVGTDRHRNNIQFPNVMKYEAGEHATSSTRDSQEKATTLKCSHPLVASE